MNEGISSTGFSVRRCLHKWRRRLAGEPGDTEEIIEVLHRAQQRGVLRNDALAMIEGVLQVSELQARDIMIPRAQMVVLNRDDPPQRFMPTIIESAHSRFPVIADERGDVAGILLAKDLLPSWDANQEIALKEILRPAAFIPESKRLDMLLREFRASRNHMAIVVDEYGAVAGLVTIEDVLEQIVGEIEDEHDFDEDAMLLQLRSNLYTIKALYPVEDFNEHFETDFSVDEFDTIGGYITNRLGHMPKRGEDVTIDHYRFEVVRADSRRVHLLRLRILPTEPAEPEEL
ncbi:MAG TPA: CBS domain-containing protein [Chromatiales bacterium]|nr:CBS domain-containing protein [Chromatiales bacterium]